MPARLSACTRRRGGPCRRGMSAGRRDGCRRRRRGASPPACPPTRPHPTPAPPSPPPRARGRADGGDGAVLEATVCANPAPAAVSVAGTPQRQREEEWRRGRGGRGEERRGEEAAVAMGLPDASLRVGNCRWTATAVMGWGGWVCELRPRRGTVARGLPRWVRSRPPPQPTRLFFCALLPRHASQCQLVPSAAGGAAACRVVGGHDTATLCRYLGIDHASIVHFAPMRQLFTCIVLYIHSCIELRLVAGG